MTRVSKKPVEKKVVKRATVGVLKDNNKLKDAFFESIQPVPVLEHIKKMGPTGTTTKVDFFTDALVDKMIQETVDALSDEEEVDEE